LKNNSALKIAAITALAFAFTCAVGSTLSAQEQEKGEQASAGSDHSMTVTGCLQKGNDPNEYSITENGKTYGLRSKSVDLSKHVGHKVSVTGTMKPESESGEHAEASEKNEAKEMKEAGDIRVSNLKMISESCQP
jgi:hypothetical protein